MDKKSLKKKSKLKVKDHLAELRYRIIVILFYVLIFSLTSYYYHQKLIFLATEPLNSTLIFLSPTAGLEMAINISIYTGILLSSPFVVYHSLCFIFPSIDLDFKSAIKIVLLTSALAITGFMFGFKIALPASLNFLTKFSVANSEYLISSKEYLVFLKLYTLGFTFIFQLPIVLYFLNKILNLKAVILFKYGIYFLPVAFLISGILTPTFDIYNQSILALPVVILYQLTILIIWLDSKRSSIKE